MLTNASTLDRREVRDNLARADSVVAKLDAPYQRLLKTINQPVEESILKDVVGGLKVLRREMNGKPALQMMFFGSIGAEKYNSELEVVEGLAKLAEAIGPDEVQIKTHTRQPSEDHVLPMEPKMVDDISREFEVMLGDAEGVSRSTPLTLRKTVREGGTVEVEILELLRRRPCRLSDLAESVSVREECPCSIVNGLIASGRVTPIRFQRDFFDKTAV